MQYDDLCENNWPTEIPVERVLGQIPLFDLSTFLCKWICAVKFSKLSYTSGQTLFCREFSPLSAGPIYLKVLSLNY